MVSAEDVKAAIDRFYRKKMKDMWTAEKMILELKKRGKRITRQRLLIIEVIAMKKSGDFKEIYYEIYRRNPNIGQATVYRMLLTLEALQAPPFCNTRAILSGVHYEDGVAIRRCAIENGVTMLTALDTVKVLLDVLEETTMGISTIDA